MYNDKQYQQNTTCPTCMSFTHALNYENKLDKLVFYVVLKPNSIKLYTAS